MSEEKVIAFLRCPASAVVDLALEMANLTWKEKLAIDLCGRQDMTQDKAAEVSEKSTDEIQRWYRSGMKKLLTAWSGQWWIENLAEEALRRLKVKKEG